MTMSMTSMGGELPSVTQANDKWLERALKHNERTTGDKRELIDQISTFPMYQTSSSGGLRKAGKLYLDPRLQKEPLGPYPGICPVNDTRYLISPGSATLFQNFKSYKGDMIKHARKKKDPKQMFQLQVVASHAIGWDAASLTPEESRAIYAKDTYDFDLNPTGTFRPKVKSKETRYAEDLILGPRHV
jgi:hypothetical protein